MASTTSINNVQFRMPDLLNARLNVALKRYGIGAGTDQLQISLLIMAPLAAMIFGRSDRERHQQQDTHAAKRPRAISEELFPQCSHHTSLSSSTAKPTTILDPGRRCRRR